MTTATLSRRISLSFGPPARRGVLIGFSAALASGLLLLIGASLAAGIIWRGSVAPRVSVAGVDLGGLSRAEALARLEATLPSLTTGQATIVVGDDETVVKYADIGRGYETQRMIDAAFAVGRDGNPVSEGIDRLRALMASIALPVEVHAFDEAAIDAVSAQIASQASHPATEASVTFDGETYEVTLAADGRRLTASDVRDALAAVVATSDPANTWIDLTAVTVQPRISTAEAEAAADSARGMVADLKLALPGDEAPIPLPADTIASWITFGADYGVDYTALLDEAAVTARLEAARETVDREPANASFALVGGGLGGVVAAVDGRELDVAASADAVIEALKSRATGGSVGSVPLVVAVTEPELTTAEAEAALPQMQMVSSWTTYYVPGDGNGYGNNINIPARDIDGRTLAPGEWFSFWGGIGPVTVERGFTYGGVIIGGRSVAGGAIGGGICSTSTTLFNAAMRAGLEIGDRMNHYYYIPRYPDGLDATVYSDDNYTQDMTFRNDTDSPIVVRGFGGNGWVRFDVWMVPTGRSVVLTDPLTSNHRTAIETTVVDTTMAPGTARRVEYPHDGHDVSRTRYVYDAAGNLIHQNTWFSSYRTVNGITAVGPRAAAPPASTPAPTPAP